MIRRLLGKTHGNMVVLANLSSDRGMPHLRRDRILRMRDRRLRRMVRYAATTVPYYRDLFRRLRIHPQDLMGPSDLDSLPLVDKKALFADPAQFVSESVDGLRSLPFLTNGTTTTRLEIRHDPGSLLANMAFGERERKTFTKTLGKSGVSREAVISYKSSTFRQVNRYYRDSTWFPVRPNRLMLSVEDRLDQLVDAINAFRPELIRGYGSHLETFFRLVSLRGIDLHRPRILLTVSDAMTAPGREFVENEFGVKVFSLYNAVEAFKIGFTCETSRGYHIHEDLCHLKIVGPDGVRVPNGKTGEIVISNLVNRGTVLLNYRLGDMGAMATEPCPCGCPLPLLEHLHGRVGDVLVLENGSLIHQSSVWGVMRTVPDVLRYQLIQIEPERFEIKILAADRVTFGRIAPDIETLLKGLLGNMAVDPVFAPELANLVPTKFRPVISRCSGRMEPALPNGNGSR